MPYPGTAPPDDSGRPVTNAPFASLDPGAYPLDSLHFSVRAYGGENAKQVSELAEAAYNRIMVDTDLYSFRPKELYRIVVYGTQEEYRRKTAMPEWSAGVSVGNSIYAFEGPGLARTVAHEMTHLVFYEYMGRADPRHRWVNEGLAVYQEIKAEGGGRGGSDIFATVRGALRQQPIPMEQMVNLSPGSEQGYTVSAWYAQAESLVRYLIERGGRIGFSQFLAALKDGRDFDSALSGAFPGVWRSLADLDEDWKRHLP